MGFSLTGITAPIECKYTQTLGVHPEIAVVRCHIQGTAIPVTGTITFTYPSQTSITLPDCQLDLARVTFSTDGHHVVIPVLDRRWKWARAAPISGYYNTRRAGAYQAVYQNSLRALATLLFTQIGDASADVSALPTTIYPEVRWDCEPAHLALEKLLGEYGYSVALGFGVENPEVVQLGVGSTLPTTNIFIEGQTFDPKVRPRWVRVCFGPSRAQVRFLLEPVVQEVDGSWEVADLGTYTPVDGWEKEDPEILPSVAINESEATYGRAIGTAFRAYRVKAFADGTLNKPDGSGALTSIRDILPLENRTLSTEDIRTDGSYRPYRVFGKFIRRVPGTGQPPQLEITDIDHEITGIPTHFDGENGIILFSEPMWYPLAGNNEFADLYLECSVGVRQANGAPAHYEEDVSFDVAGFGYHTLRVPELRAETIISYDAAHGVTSFATNQTALDAVAATLAATLIPSYSTTAGVMRVYAIPNLALRCDGAIQQIQHVMTEGERSDAVNRTIASWNVEFDRGIPSRAQRIAHTKAVLDSATERWHMAIQKREELADD